MRSLKHETSHCGGRRAGFRHVEGVRLLARSDVTLFLTARDAFNGLFLWKIDLDMTDDGSMLCFGKAE